MSRAPTDAVARQTTRSICDFCRRYYQSSTKIGDTPARTTETLSSLRFRYHHEHHRVAAYNYFSTTTETTKCRSSSRRRKPRSPQQQQQIVTSKDRMRRLVETNQKVVQTQTLKALNNELNRLYDIASSRLSWVKMSIYSHWNPDYKASGAPSRSSLATNDPAATVSRPAKVGPNMDAQWWAWNIAFALLPAFVIGTYCEFRGQHRMIEYERKRQLDHMKRLLGEDYDSEYEELLPEIKTPEPFVNRLWKVMKDLSTNVAGIMGDVVAVQDPAKDPKLPHTDSGADGVAKEEMKERQTKIMQESASTTISAAQATTTDHSTGETDGAPKAASSEADLTQRELLSRIEKLEAIVMEQKERRKRDIQRQLNRMDESGLQNRMDGEFLDSLKQRSGDPKAKSPPDLSINSHASWSWSSMAMERASSVLERVQSAFQEKTNDVPEQHQAPEPPSLSKRSEIKSVDIATNPPRNTIIDASEGSDSDKHIVETSSESSSSSDSVLAPSSATTPWWKVW